MGSLKRIALLFAVAVVVGGCGKKAAPPTPTPVLSADPRLPAFEDRPIAPDIAGASAWINVDRALGNEDLEGRVTVIDFWTSCCINCLHTLPVLAALEKKHAKNPAVLVVGVHSPKFDAETENERLRAAIAENDIRHPVAVDGSMKIWTRWKAQSWPTIIVLDSKRRMVWIASGEPKLEELEKRVAAALDEGARAGTLAKTPVSGLHPDEPDPTPLAFPGKIIALEDGGFAIADTGHHRVVIVDASFAVKDVVGVGFAGAVDGPYAEASFRKPQGLAETDGKIFVADTENHALRVIDRKARSVSTIAGTGTIGRAALREKSPARETALRSPWDLVATGGLVYVALAGSHQIGIFDPKDGTIAAFAGDGAERRVDGVGAAASFAQPSGLATNGTTLWVADSETSSVRAITLATRAVKTVVGKDLFVFGDVDGAADAVRLEHPLGLAFGTFTGQTPGLIVADTYNSKIKRIDVATGSTRSLYGARTHEMLFEPSGLVIKGGHAIVADTKHHRIVRLRPDGEQILGEPIVPKGLVAPPRGLAVEGVKEAEAPAETIALTAPLADGADVLEGRWSLPPGTGVNEEAPFKLRWTKEENLGSLPPPQKTMGAAVKDGFRVGLHPKSGVSHASLEGVLDMVVCDVATHKVCVPFRRKLVLTFAVQRGPGAATVTIPLPEAKVK